MDITRRKLAGILAASAAVPAMAAEQTGDSDEDLKIQREQMRNNAQQLAKVALPMAVEPPFHFRP